MDIEALFPIFFSFVFFRSYRSAQVLNISYRDGNLKMVKIPRKWRWLFRLKWENVLLWSVIEQAICLVAIIMEITCGYVLYIFAPVGMCGIFCWIIFFIAGLLILINTLFWGRKYSANVKKKCLPGKRCMNCEIEAAFRTMRRPMRRVFVDSVMTSLSGNELFVIRYEKTNGKLFYARASEYYKPVIGTYAKAMYISEKPHFILVSEWKTA